MEIPYLLHTFILTFVSSDVFLKTCLQQGIHFLETFIKGQIICKVATCLIN